MEIMSFFGQKLGLLVEAIEFASFQYNHFGIIAVSFAFHAARVRFYPDFNTLFALSNFFGQVGHRPPPPKVKGDRTPLSRHQ